MGTISFSFEKYLYMVCLKMAHLGRVTYCFETLLILCKLVFFNYNFHKNTRSRQKRVVSKQGQPRLYTQLKARLLTEQLKLHYSVHYYSIKFVNSGFRSVAVITSAPHAEGRQFNSGRKQECCLSFFLFFIFFSFTKRL